MADVSTWSPIDESNVTAPPHGWPENQPTNTVNNCGRAMMGAIRRLYDQLIAGTLALPYFKTTGGPISGSISASGDISCNQLFSNGVSSNGTIVSATQLTSNGGINAASDIAAGGTVSGALLSSSGNINAAAYRCGDIALISQSGAQRTLLDTGGTSNVTMYTTGENYYDNNQHNFRARLGVSTFAIFTAGGTYNVNGSWGVISDEAAKTEIAGYTRGLAAIRALSPVSYKYAGGPFASDETQYGLIAQDMQTIVPEMVGEVDLGGERFLTMQPGHLVFVLCNAVRELAARLEALEEKSDV